MRCKWKLRNVVNLVILPVGHSHTSCRPILHMSAAEFCLDKHAAATNVTGWTAGVSCKREKEGDGIVIRMRLPRLHVGVVLPLGYAIIKPLFTSYRRRRSLQGGVD